MIEKDSKITAKQVAETINVTQRQAERLFASLTKKGFITRIGADKTVTGKYWSRVPNKFQISLQMTQ